jgi:hypothetical protein
MPAATGWFPKNQVLAIQADIAFANKDLFCAPHNNVIAPQDVKILAYTEQKHILQIVLVHVLWEEKQHGTAASADPLRLHADPGSRSHFRLQHHGRWRA